MRRKSFSQIDRAKGISLYQQGMSAPEIATQMNCGISTVYHWLSRLPKTVVESGEPKAVQWHLQDENKKLKELIIELLVRDPQKALETLLRH